MWCCHTVIIKHCGMSMKAPEGPQPHTYPTHVAKPDNEPLHYLAKSIIIFLGYGS